ncbi:hypothetical protein J6590_026900 [Homalodisca vitripennis]|nr:hypothetical protein J6590_026900 [Homalodisca vitripennis]
MVGLKYSSLRSVPRRNMVSGTQRIRKLFPATSIQSLLQFTFFLVQRLESDSDTELTLRIWSHVRLERSKKLYLPAFLMLKEGNEFILSFLVTDLFISPDDMTPDSRSEVCGGVIF